MKRRDFSSRVKLAAFDRANGRCEIKSCGAKLHPGRFTYDHIIPDYQGGEPALQNCQVICRDCDRIKTGKDQTSIAKDRRIRKREAGIKKPSSFRGWRKFDGTPVRNRAHTSRQ